MGYLQTLKRLTFPPNADETQNELGKPNANATKRKCKTLDEKRKTRFRKRKTLDDKRKRKTQNEKPKLTVMNETGKANLHRSYRSGVRSLSDPALTNNIGAWILRISLSFQFFFYN
ncbi:hypothetical protein CI610_03011 [invertebrate metagenome]|uniref:Uncharacterized protein n=1 Tax=invertebrate metagenome TaxID=1711999 RepID=A0A2H9T499_9ZZZZ